MNDYCPLAGHFGCQTLSSLSVRPSALQAAELTLALPFGTKPAKKRCFPFAELPVKSTTEECPRLAKQQFRALRRLKRDYPETPYVFVTERKGPVTDSAVRKFITRAGEAAKLGESKQRYEIRHRKTGCHDGRASYSCGCERRIESA